jgi:4-hydroxybenzoate polyprenyltransferase
VKSDTPHTVAGVFTALLGSSVTISWWRYEDVGLSLIIALVWTFSLGVTEVAKRAHLVETKQALAGPKESGKFYAAGANWSSILFFNLLLLMPVLVPSPSMLLIVIVAWGLIAFWHIVHDKYSRFAYFGSLFMGLILPISIIALFTLAKSTGLNSDSHFPVSSATDPTDRFITLLGIFLMIIFLLYHQDYISMTTKLKNDPYEWFMSRRSCLLFAALTVAVEAVLLTFIFSIVGTERISEDAAISGNAVLFQVDFVLAFLIVELIAILIMLFLEPDPNATTDHGSAKGVGPASQATTAPTARMGLDLTRPLNSSIAGLLAFVVGISLSALDLQAAIRLFISTTTLCMFGYIANDIFDREKDRRAGRRDKVIATGVVPLGNAASLATALLLASLISARAVSDNVFLIVSAGAVLVTGYSYFSHRFPKLKGLYTALLCCLPAIFGAGMNLSAMSVKMLLLISLFIFGREMLIDITDMDFDKRSGHSTLAVTLGPNRAAVIGWITMLASGPVIFTLETNLISQIIAALAILSLLTILLAHGFRNMARSVSLSRIPMLLSIMAFSIHA